MGGVSYDSGFRTLDVKRSLEGVLRWSVVGGLGYRVMGLRCGVRV